MVDENVKENQNENQTGTQMEEQVGTQMEEQVGTQMENQVGIQTENQAEKQTENQAENFTAKIEELKKEINVLKGKKTTFEEKKEKIIKARDEEIKKVLYAKKTEIEKTYGEILTEAEKRLKATKYDKEKERKKNIENLVEQKTKTEKDSIFYLKKEIQRLLKDNGIPGFVNSEFYFTMWSPYTIWQTIKGIIISIALMAIPTFLIFHFFKEKIEATFPNTAVRIIIICLIYALFIFVFAGIWLIIDKATKKKPEILKEIIEFRKNIKNTEKKIKDITIKTTKEVKDSDFDYTKLDREIEAGEIEVKNLKERQQNALNEFTNTTQNQIVEKYKKESQNAIDELDNEIENIKAEINTKQKEEDELKIKALG